MTLVIGIVVVLMGGWAIIHGAAIVAWALIEIVRQALFGEPWKD